MDENNTIAEIIDNLRRTIQALNEHYKNAERGTGLTSPQLWAIKLIAAASPIKVSELARRMFLHPATIVGILDRLEAKGLVARTRSTEDRRVVELDLTAQGREFVARAPEPAQDLLLKGLEALPAKQLHLVADGMDQLVRILGAEKREPQLLFSQEVSLKNIDRPANNQ